MSCNDIPSLLDLQNTKKHIDDFGRLMGTGEGDSTNEVTGQVRPTYNKVMKSVGFKPGSGDFTTGFTVMPGERDIAWYDPVSKNWYSYLGVIPTSGHPVAPGTNPVGNIDWAPRTDEALRSELGSNNGINIIGGANVYSYTANGVDDSAGILAANNAAISANKQLRIIGVAKVISPVTISAQLYDSLNQIFTLDSAVNISNSLTIVRPEMFGDVVGSLDKAIKVLPITGGTVYLISRRYKHNGYAYNTGAYMSKANVSIIGEKMPWFNGDCTALVDGSIIEGTFLAWAPNLELVNIGVDSGKAFCDVNYGGTPQEALIITYPSDTIKNSEMQLSGLKTHNVISLCASPTAQVHAIILGEGYRNVRATGELVGMYGTHGIVFKNTDVVTGVVTAYSNGGEGVIIKSDSQGSAIANNIRIGGIIDRAEGPFNLAPHLISTSGAGVMLNPALNAIDNIKIGDINTSGHPYGVVTAIPSTFPIREVSIKSVSSSKCEYPVAISAPAGVQLTQVSIGAINGRDCADVIDVNCATPQATPIVIGELNGLTVTGSCMNAHDNGNIVINSVSAESVTTSVFRVGTSKLKIGAVSKPNSTSVLDAGSAPTLINGWDQVVGGEAFGIELNGYRVKLKGLVGPTTANNTLATLPEWARPSVVKRFVCQGATASAQSAVAVVIDPNNGTVIVNEIGGGTTNCSQWLSLDIEWEI